MRRNKCNIEETKKKHRAENEGGDGIILNQHIFSLRTITSETPAEDNQYQLRQNAKQQVNKQQSFSPP